MLAPPQLTENVMEHQIAKAIADFKAPVVGVVLVLFSDDSLKGVRIEETPEHSAFKDEVESAYVGGQLMPARPSSPLRNRPPYIKQADQWLQYLGATVSKRGGDATYAGRSAATSSQLSYRAGASHTLDDRSHSDSRDILGSTRGSDIGKRE